MATLIHRWPLHETGVLNNGEFEDVVGGVNLTAKNLDGDEAEDPGVALDGVNEYLSMPPATIDPESFDHTFTLWWKTGTFSGNKGLFSIGRSDADAVRLVTQLISGDSGVRTYFWDDSVTQRGYAFLNNKTLVNANGVADWVFSVFLLKPRSAGVIPTDRAWRHYHAIDGESSMHICNGPEWGGNSDAGVCTQDLAVFGADVSTGVKNYMPGSLRDIRVYSGLITDTDEMLTIMGDYVYTPPSSGSASTIKSGGALRLGLGI